MGPASLLIPWSLSHTAAWRGLGGGGAPRPALQAQGSQPSLCSGPDSKSTVRKHLLCPPGAQGATHPLSDPPPLPVS